MSKYFILQDKQTIQVDDVLERGQWVEASGEERVVAYTELLYDKDKYSVSTVFLGIDHGFIENQEPILFETMVFKYKKDHKRRCEYGEYTERYSTRKQAEKGHTHTIFLLRKEFGKGLQLKKE